MNTTVIPPSLLDVDFPAGSVALVGAGPGDPGLLTLRAWALLQQAEVVVYDRLVARELIALLPESCQRIYVGKRCGHHSLPQEEINELLVRLARQQRRVVRLKGGDPFIFGRGAEELERLLEAGVDCQVVPGVTAASGCSTYAGIPLTHRDLAQSCTFVTGHLQNDGRLDLDWAGLARGKQTLVFYMGLGNLAEIAARLVEHGLASDTPAALVSQGTQAGQQVTRGALAELPALARRYQLKPPTLIVVGQVVALDLDQAQPGAGQLGQQRTNQGGLAGPAGPPEQGVVGRLAGDELAGVAFQLLALPLYAQQVGQAQVEADLQRLQVAATAVAVPARRQAALPVDGFAYGRQQRLQAREHAFGAGKKIAQSGIHSVLLGSD